jgi:hypothetical protein
MKGFDMQSYITRPVLRPSERSTWYAFGLWLRVVFVGMAALATGVAQLLERSHAHAPVPALTWLIGGGVLAAFAWHRAHVALQRLGDAETTAERTASADNLRASHHRVSGTGAGLFGLPATARAGE